MERAAIRGKVTLSGRDLGGEFPVQDMESKQGGLLQVRIDGITLLFEDRQVKLLVNITFCFEVLKLAYCIEKFYSIFESLSAFR